ncbi:MULTISPECIES: hypothetical protein [unclassified Leisingera]|nr:MULTISPECIES: hypothetical protein [unclassified Leisingera]
MNWQNRREQAVREDVYSRHCAHPDCFGVISNLNLWDPLMLPFTG